MEETASKLSCLSESNTVLLSLSRKNCDNEISKASHIFIKEGIEGYIFFLYHEEIVDCVSPDFSAN